MKNDLMDIYPFARGRKVYQIYNPVELHDKKFLEKEVQALKIFATNYKDLHDIATQLDFPEVAKRRGYDLGLTTHYIIEKKFEPLKWYEIEGEVIDNSEKLGGIGMHMEVDTTILLSELKFTKNDEFEPRVLAYDIETDELQIGEGEIVMLSLASKNYKKVITWKKGKTKQDFVEYVGDEAEMLERFVECVKEFSGIILVLRKRIIFTLIYENGLFNQSRNFRLQKVGNIDWLEKNYRLQDIAFSLDEIVVLNASRGDKDIKRFATILNRLVDDVFIPIAAGGGVNSIADAETLFENGADKIVLNSALYENPNMVKEIVQHYGKQSVVASVDYADNEVFIENGSKKIDMLLGQYIEYIESLGVGEIYLNSIIRDGTGFGYDIDTIQQVSSKIKVPLIVAGGAGNEKHLLEAIEIEGVSAIATANLFNFMGDGLPKARKAMVDKGVNLVNWR